MTNSLQFLLVASMCVAVTASSSVDLTELLSQHGTDYKVNYLLYLDRALNSWGDRCWEFAIGLYLIKLNPDSLLLTALQGILASVLSIVLLPYMGAWISRVHRMKEIAVFLFISNLCVFIAATPVALFFLGDHFVGHSLHQTITKVAPYVLVIFSAIEQVTSSGYTLSLEKDWIIVIAKDEKQLSSLNASLRRIDLIIKTIAPLVTGLIMEYSDFASAMFLLLYNCVSGCFEYLIMRIIYKKVPPLSEPKIGNNETSNDTTNEEHNERSTTFFNSISIYMKHYGLPGISYSLIYLSVLRFDSITVGFMSAKGVSESVIGAASVLGALTGIVGTMVFQLIIKYSTLQRIVSIGYLSDLIPLLLCLVIVVVPNHLLGINIFNYDLAMGLFLAGITLSEAGLWMIDLSNNQLIQINTPNPALIGGMQTSLNTTAELIKFIITAILSKMSQFYVLIIISVGSTVLATFISIYFSIKSY